MTDTNSPSLDLSVVIGFKDWGQDRLLLSIRHIHDAMMGVQGEIIVSDYGSTQAEGLKDLVEEAGARYICTTTDGVWSRARALNAGFAVAVGDVLASTDADMLFSPGSLAAVTSKVQTDPDTAVVLQCRDLPEHVTRRLHAQGVQDWSTLDASARLRPRWGMGGLMAASRMAYDRVHGFDERMEIYGAEDIDFANRLRRAGTRIHWLEDDSVRMYHIWHPSSRQAADSTARGRAAIALNRDIMLNDPSYVRNTVSWRHRSRTAQPTATVVIATRNRADLLLQSLQSVLAQSVQDIEIIVADDGSTDHTADVVASLDDERVVYNRHAHSGLAATRQRVAAMTRSEFTVVHDDDDIMLPWRIEAHFEALGGGIHGTYGGWADFSDQTGEVTFNPGKAHSLEALLFAGKVYAHGTLMVRTDLIRKVGYDNTFASGSDYNMAIRMARAGVKLAHTGKFHILRRLHDRQVTTVDTSRQQEAAVLTSFMARSAIDSRDLQAVRKASENNSPGAVERPADAIRVYLPDHLVERRATAGLDEQAARSEAGQAIIESADHCVVVGNITYISLQQATWDHLTRLSRLGAATSVWSAGDSNHPRLELQALRQLLMDRFAHGTDGGSDAGQRVLRVIPAGRLHGDRSGEGNLDALSEPPRVEVLEVAPGCDILDVLERETPPPFAALSVAAVPWDHEDLATHLRNRNTTLPAGGVDR